MRRDLMDVETAQGMLAWPRSGCHVHDGVWVAADDREFAVRLARYCSNLRNYGAKDGKLAIAPACADGPGDFVGLPQGTCHPSKCVVLECLTVDCHV